MEKKDVDLLNCLLFKENFYDILTMEDINNVIDVLYITNGEEILNIIKNNRQNIRTINANNIPQFSKFDDIYKVLKIVDGAPVKDIDWMKLGYYFCPIDAKNGARRKYGENHYKLAIQLGLAKPGKPLKLTSLGAIVNDITDDVIKEKILSKLIFRIPIIQIALLHSENEIFNMQSYMENYLSHSTVIRRRPNIKFLLHLLDKTSQDSNFRSNLLNIVWFEEDYEI